MELGTVSAVLRGMGLEKPTTEAPMKLGTKIVLASLTVVFTIGLTFASVELPRLVSSALIEHVDAPGFDPTYHPEETEAFLAAHSLRLIGFIGLAVTCALIAVGLAAERRGMAAAGAVLFFLPIFGHFAASMFFLAGLAILRVLWLPILDISHDVMALGDVVYLPYAAVVWPLVNLGLDIRDQLPWLVMCVGVAIFVTSTLAWMNARFQGRAVAESWLYRISRHPQYLGWIVWSYGMLLFVLRHSELYQFKIRWSMPSSLAWLVSTLVIIGVAMIEEIRMRASAGEGYSSYRSRTPFLLPVPRWLSAVISFPMRLVLRRPWPATGAQVAVTIAVYASILIALSVPFVLFDWPPRIGWWGFPYNVWPLG
jgi:protein-S-isoprenylcysteine O-methyltransferase Ste14